MLEAHLSAICPVMKTAPNQFSLFIFDNSTGSNAVSVRTLASVFGVRLLQAEGASLSSNFRKINEIEPHHYCMLPHDDDISYISDLHALLLELVSSISLNIVFAAESIYINDSKRRCIVNRHIPLLPLFRSIFPWRLPAFPAWIYPMDDIFLQHLDRFLLSFPAGKYSDIIFLDRYLSARLLESGGSVHLAPGIKYLYRYHSSQDSAAFEFCTYAYMLLQIKGLMINKWYLVFLHLCRTCLLSCLLRPVLVSCRRSLGRFKA